MTSIFQNILSDDDINYLNKLPEVIEAKIRLDASNYGKIYFNIQITDSIRNTLSKKFSLDLQGISNVPMRWIKGDTLPHIDRGVTEFENTYLIYINDSPGEFVINNLSYPILSNTGYIFNEGLLHETQNTGNTSRLLLGPMNEFAQAVGRSVMYYYPSETDALANTNEIVQYGSYNIVDVSGYTHWKIASNSTGPASQSLVYNVGQVLPGSADVPDLYYLYPVSPCFLIGTQILCQVDGIDKYIPVEDLNKNMLVKTSKNGYKKVVLIGKGKIKNPGTNDRIENRLYKCSVSNYPELIEDLYITGCHSILVNSITEKQCEDIIKHLGRIFVTENKYRLIACIDERAEPWNSEGIYIIYHFALEHIDEKMNYGIYANGGLLVETCSIRFLKNKSNMILM